MAPSKLDALRKLVQKRRQPNEGTRATGYSLDYKKCGDYHQGIYDFDEHVVPYSKSAFNLDADLMVIGQDWASDTKLTRDKATAIKDQSTLGHDPTLPYNRNLFRLLRDHFNMSFSETYSTDAFVFIKPGDMSGKLPRRDLVRSAFEYAIPQINIVCPRIVLCLGASTYNAIRMGLNLPYQSLRQGSVEPPYRYGKSWLVPIPHAGGPSTGFLGGTARLNEEWARVAATCAKL